MDNRSPLLKTWYGVGFIAGCFDLIHPGYIVALKEAKSVCDHLMVGLHSDPTIERPEKTKPVLSLEDRMATLQAIRYIDSVVPYDKESDLLSILESDSPKIDVRFLGDDYRDRTDYTGYGLDIDIYCLSRDHGWSATKLRDKIKRSTLSKWSETQIQGWFDCCYTPSNKTQDKNGGRDV